MNVFILWIKIREILGELMLPWPKDELEAKMFSDLLREQGKEELAAAYLENWEGIDNYIPF